MSRGIMQKKKKHAVLAAKALIFLRVICFEKSLKMKKSLITVLIAVPHSL